MSSIRIILAILLNVCGSHISASEGTGRMDCKVKSNKIIGIVEGKPTEYSGYQNQFIIGDNLAITYGFEHETVVLKIFDNAKGQGYFNLLVDQLHKDTSSWESGGGIGAEAGDDKIWISHDRIESKNFAWTSDGNYVDAELALTRYYKNDWQGIVANKVDHTAIHIFTLDCRHSVDYIDVMLRRMDGLKALHKIHHERSIVENIEEQERSARLKEAMQRQIEALRSALATARSEIVELNSTIKEN